MPLHRREPFACFERVFGKPMHDPGPDEYGDLLPANWIKTRPSATRSLEAEVA